MSKVSSLARDLDVENSGLGGLQMDIEENIGLGAIDITCIWGSCYQAFDYLRWFRMKSWERLLGIFFIFILCILAGEIFQFVAMSRTATMLSRWYS